MGKPNPRVSNGSARRQLRRWWKAQELPCQVCGRGIDYSLPAGHPMSFEVDEKVPVSRGGDPLSRENTGPAHRCCNQWKGAMTLDEAHARLRARSMAREVERSGKW
jgi:hypothetical protein